MSKTNGDDVLKIGKIGRINLRYDDEKLPNGGYKYPAVAVDVIATMNQWYEIDQSFRDEKGELPPQARMPWTQAAVQYASHLLQVPDGEMSGGSALHFLKVITDEGNRLKPFFEPNSVDAPSSRASTELIFSREEIPVD